MPKISNEDGTLRDPTGLWFLGVTALLAVGCLLCLLTLERFQYGIFFSSGFPYIALGFYGFFAIAAISMARKWMVFVRLAEKVFKTLGLPDPSNIDLVKTSKAQRKPGDPGEFGTFYFRY